MKALNEKLEDIRDSVVGVHILARKSIEYCLEGLMGDNEAEEKVKRIEKTVDVMNTDIDCKCISTVALFHPLARDLRFVLTMVRVSGNYERVTDLSAKIARYSVRDGEMINRFFEMRENILKMFDILGNALEGGEIDGLKSKLMELDNKIDNDFVDVIESLKTKNPLSDEMVDTILTSKYLERIGDILTKTGSRYIFVEEGRRVWIK